MVVLKIAKGLAGWVIFGRKSGLVYFFYVIQIENGEMTLVIKSESFEDKIKNTKEGKSYFERIENIKVALVRSNWI